MLDGLIEEIEEEEEQEEEPEEDSVASSKEPENDSYSYTMQLKFYTNIFGTFKQTIIFDFGQRPLLSKVWYPLI